MKWYWCEIFTEGSTSHEIISGQNLELNEQRPRHSKINKKTSHLIKKIENRGQMHSNSDTLFFLGYSKHEQSI